MTTIGIIAPSSPSISVTAQQRVIGVANLEALGYQVLFSPNFDERLFHTAGTTFQRVSDLEWALESADVDIIMTVFGGQNSNQLLSHINFTKYAYSSFSHKMLVGFSDITALLLAFYANGANLKLVHGPSFAVFCDPSVFNYTSQYFKAVLEGTTIKYAPPDECADDDWYMKSDFGPREVYQHLGWRIWKEGVAEGPIIGGNLNTIGALLGTPFFPNTSGHLLFLEDRTGNNPGSFHRTLTQLYQAKVFHNARGVIFGKFPRASALDDQKLMRHIVEDIFSDFEFPIIGEVNCSHIDPKMSILMGATAKLDTSNATLTILGFNSNNIKS